MLSITDKPVAGTGDAVAQLAMKRPGNLERGEGSHNERGGVSGDAFFVQVITHHAFKIKLLRVNHIPGHHGSHMHLMMRRWMGPVWPVGMAHWRPGRMSPRMTVVRRG